MVIYLHWREQSTEADTGWPPDEPVRMINQEILDAGGGDTEVRLTYEEANRKNGPANGVHRNGPG